jgi:hypothetical protein
VWRNYRVLTNQDVMSGAELKVSLNGEQCPRAIAHISILTGSPGCSHPDSKSKSAIQQGIADEGQGDCQVTLIISSNGATDHHIKKTAILIPVESTQQWS